MGKFGEIDSADTRGIENCYCCCLSEHKMTTLNEIGIQILPSLSQALADPILAPAKLR